MVRLYGKLLADSGEREGIPNDFACAREQDGAQEVDCQNHHCQVLPFSEERRLFDVVLLKLAHI